MVNLAGRQHVLIDVGEHVRAYDHSALLLMESVNEALKGVLIGVNVVAVRHTATRGPALAITVTAIVLIVLVAWRWRWPESFTRVVVCRPRGVWRAASVYRYVWQPAMVATGLAIRVDGTEYLPRIVSVASTATVDRVRVRMLPGQTQPDWATNGLRLAQTFGAVDCRTRSVPGRVHELVLWFLTADPLKQ